MSRFSGLFARLLMIAALTAGPAAGVRAATIKAVVKANVVKPLVLKVKQDLDFGQIALPGTPGTRIVSISTTGVLTCGAGLTCSGAARRAIFNVTGSNGQVARISTAASNLTNGSGGTIVFTPLAPASVTFTNSGNGGIDFGVGGSISLPSTTNDGLYSGTVEVTVDYQ